MVELLPVKIIPFRLLNTTAVMMLPDCAWSDPTVVIVFPLRLKNKLETPRLPNVLLSSSIIMKLDLAQMQTK